VLREYGQILVGIDVIGGRLTEINITSPTGVRHIAALDQRDVGADVLGRIVAAAKARTAG
jgi:glutathione synthase